MVTVKLIDEVKAIAIEAGSKILEIYHREYTATEKEDNSPLTEADLAANEVIVNALNKLSDYPVLSEESSAISWQERQQWGTYWLVDPLDGTKEFIKKNGEFTVNIALIHDGFPVMGVVYAPVLGKCYWGSVEYGAFVEEAGNITELSVTSANLTSNSMTRVVGSRSHPSPQLADYLEQFDQVEMVPMGSSLKFCVIAEGNADIYPRLGPTSEWDTGAAQAVLEAAGGKVIDFETNERLAYNQKESVLNPFFIAQS
ncbi:3'(2'),5'-bisphosphate nucleotidase CysQ [Flocculibacter collagenilyticus]|uniref:3'(2'),5'-bisphosphate nucleotidase CysQ n=1 Tax=Flocculibacter collagenilyticus TaxID=2744479 RepID=UPI0018F474AC|nr:3'(2'),5'-bisphosphate nucleotidase CysQ [Flocculibacter collagenilyticus]